MIFFITGINAQCRVVDHRPVCSCGKNLIGDPLIQCANIPSRNMTRDPCDPSPCGANVPCYTYSNNIAICDECSAFDGQCRKECSYDSECPAHLACLSNKCVDPCPGVCGQNSDCDVVYHKPICKCKENMNGNPYYRCDPMLEEPRVTCNNMICGENAQCNQSGRAFKCVCEKGFYGDPLAGCRPECRINSDCSGNKACQNNKCIDPCVGACGINSRCEVKNHRAICTCIENFKGDPYERCNEVMNELPYDNKNPCNPSPCGPNSRCVSARNGVAVCSCLDSHIGQPPNCRPECISSSECLSNEACINGRCVNPCVGTCAENAECQVVNHNPICSCPRGLHGDPFIKCYLQEPIDITNPCDPSPCGRNSECQIVQNRAVCSCTKNMIGKPPYCRPECILNSECPQDKSCINEKCSDPCPGACGQNTFCQAVNHLSICSCRKGFEGDAFIGCTETMAEPKDTMKYPCDSQPCGVNTNCKNEDGNRYTCSCIPPYRGDPYSSGCKPECLSSTECASHLSCINQFCRDPCPGVCGRNANCLVINHIPTCECSNGMVGDPFRACRDEVITPDILVNPCEPSPCGLNSLCRIVDGRPACSCLPEMKGVPPNCRPECVVSSECKSSEACISAKCRDPCAGTCGLNANCKVINHNPVCSCPTNYLGDPFVMCTLKRELIFIYVNLY